MGLLKQLWNKLTSWFAHAIDSRTQPWVDDPKSSSSLPAAEISDNEPVQFDSTPVAADSEPQTQSILELPPEAVAPTKPEPAPAVVAPKTLSPVAAVKPRPASAKKAPKPAAVEPSVSKPAEIPVPVAVKPVLVPAPIVMSEMAAETDSDLDVEPAAVVPNPVSRVKAKATPEENAKRLARALISDLKLYNDARVVAGKAQGNLYDILQDDIEKSRKHYEDRVGDARAKMPDYFYQELVSKLCEGDASKLGPNYKHA